MELSSTLHKYLNDQSVQETWNTLQENVKCYIVYYEAVMISLPSCRWNVAE